jgi:hypothetical protein
MSSALVIISKMVKARVTGKPYVTGGTATQTPGSAD